MKATTPRVEAHMITIAEDQPEYGTLVGAVVNHPLYPARLVTLKEGSEPMPANTILTAWEFSPEERMRIMAGEPLYLGVLTMLTALQPVLPVVGVRRACDIYGVIPTEQPDDLALMEERADILRLSMFVKTFIETMPPEEAMEHATDLTASSQRLLEKYA